MALKANLVIDQGTDYETAFTITDFADIPQNLNGYTGKAQIRKYYTSTTGYDMGVSINAGAGKVTLTMDAANTAVITHGRYVYDVELTANSGAISRVLEGIVTITPRVTR